MSKLAVARPTKKDVVPNLTREVVARLIRENVARATLLRLVLGFQDDCLIRINPKMFLTVTNNKAETEQLKAVVITLSEDDAQATVVKFEYTKVHLGLDSNPWLS